MKLSFGLIVALAVLAPTFTKTVPELKIIKETILGSNLKTLHREPFTGTPVGRAAIVKTSWIEQKLDQFNVEDTRTWQMRYMSNDEFYQLGGPLFIFVGGEWSISPGNLQSGHMYDMASENRGYLAYTEHRYYGLSQPTSDLSTENLKYLHVRQALADLAHFIRTIKTAVRGMANSKVILVGGSYSATMVTWFKKLYPELAAGCWASSAPLFAKVDFEEYKEVTGESIRLVGGENCYNRIQSGIAELESMIQQDRVGEAKALLKICNNFDASNDLDVWSMFSEISDVFAGVVQTHDEGKIQNACKEIMKGDDDFIGLVTYLVKAFGDRSPCNDFSYDSSIEHLRDLKPTGMARQWIYQTCNEYGWYQTSRSKKQPFGTKFPLTLYTSMCQDAFGDQFNRDFMHKQVIETNMFFGGLRPEVEDVYQTHGQLDPWSAMGIREKDQATVIPMYAHCKDLSSIKEDDTPEMLASKEKIAELVRKWVGVVDSN